MSRDLVVKRGKRGNDRIERCLNRDGETLSTINVSSASADDTKRLGTEGEAVAVVTEAKK